MAQFGRPNADTNNDGAWVDEGAGSTNLWDGIDEASPSDADYIESPTAPSSDPITFALTTLEDPQVSTGHTVRYRYQKDTSGGAQIDLTVQLRQGYVSEASQGTLIHSEAVTNIANGWTTGSFTLSAGEADSITDYTDLYIRIVANQV